MGNRATLCQSAVGLLVALVAFSAPADRFSPMLHTASRTHRESVLEPPCCHGYTNPKLRMGPDRPLDISPHPKLKGGLRHLQSQALRTGAGLLKMPSPRAADTTEMQVAA